MRYGDEKTAYLRNSNSEGNHFLINYLLKKDLIN